MRRVLALIACAALLGGCAGVRPPQDKLKHFAVSAGVGAAATRLAINDGAPVADARLVGIGVVLVVGGGKELYDREIKGTGWSWSDMLWNLLGGLVGTTVASHGD